MYFRLRADYPKVARSLLLHVICVRFLPGRRLEVLPCTYGYGQTIRKCQGLTLVHGCLFFDSPKFPAARGYGPLASFAIPSFCFVLCLVCGTCSDCASCYHWRCDDSV